MRPAARPTADPINRMGTSLRTAGESLADLNYGRCAQELAPLVEHALLDHVVRAPQHRRRDREPARLRGLPIDDQLELRWLFDGEVGRLGASENLVHVDCGAPPEPP